MAAASARQVAGAEATGTAASAVVRVAAAERPVEARCPPGAPVVLGMDHGCGPGPLAVEECLVGPCPGPAQAATVVVEAGSVSRPMSLDHMT
jgi:hypothetical protein